ncbi:MAG TPA: class I SAM-dependent methyltransferase [Thermoanaerobaculia bacterium]|nr:class I SAM-dependent methyltransferase [Thermoanaerobaculia bacterium]
MESNFFNALSLVRQASAGMPAAARVHVIGRFLTCPFLRVLAHVPPGARLLDLGAGHGTLARLAAERGASSVVAVEPDVRKTLPTARHPRVRFVAGYADAVGGAFDAVTILDVLYRIPLAGWDPLLATAFERLRPGGVFLLKEIDPEHRLKGRWNRTQERIADLLGMTLGEAFSYETREQIRERLARHGFERFEAIEMGAGYPHAHILYKAWRPAVVLS